MTGTFLLNRVRGGGGTFGKPAAGYSCVAQGCHDPSIPLWEKGSVVTAQDVAAIVASWCGRVRCPLPSLGTTAPPPTQKNEALGRFCWSVAEITKRVVWGGKSYRAIFGSIFHCGSMQRVQQMICLFQKGSVVTSLLPPCLPPQAEPASKHNLHPASTATGPRRDKGRRLFFLLDCHPLRTAIGPSDQSTAGQGLKERICRVAVLQKKERKKEIKERRI